MNTNKVIVTISLLIIAGVAGFFYVELTTPIPGCMDDTAYNYNPQATEDDGSCIARIFGCLDKAAINYKNNANTDDGSCVSVSQAMKNNRETTQKLYDNPSSFKGKEVEINLMMFSQRFPESVGYYAADGKGGLREYAKWANEDGIPVMFGSLSPSSVKAIFINIPPSLDLPNEESNSKLLIKFICNEGSLTSGNTAINIQRAYYN